MGMGRCGGLASFSGGIWRLPWNSSIVEPSIYFKQVSINSAFNLLNIYLSQILFGFPGACIVKEAVPFDEKVNLVLTRHGILQLAFINDTIRLIEKDALANGKDSQWQSSFYPEIVPKVFTTLTILVPLLQELFDTMLAQMFAFDLSHRHPLNMMETHILNMT